MGKNLAKKQKRDGRKNEQKPVPTKLIWQQSGRTTQPEPWVNKTIEHSTMGKNGKASIRVISIDGGAESSNTKDGRIITDTTSV